MAIEINTKVSLEGNYEARGQTNLGNMTLEDAKFFGRPNFAGEMDRFKDNRRQFTVLIPNNLADELRGLGWNVKTTIPTEEQKAEGREELSHMKVMVDDNSTVQMRVGQDVETLTVSRFGIVDRTRIEVMDMEVRAWMYNGDEVRDGTEKPAYSARLVALVAVIKPNILEQKYGMLG